MDVVVGSQNPVKIQAVLSGFQKIWPKETWQVKGVSVASGVSHQPMSSKESLAGAQNRAIRALKASPTATYAVGLEGGLEQVNGIWFDCGWCVIVDRRGIQGVATSARIETPETIMKHIQQGKELGDAIDIIFDRHNAKQAEGQFGLMTNGVVTRTDGYIQAVCLALSRYLHPEIF